MKNTIVEEAACLLMFTNAHLCNRGGSHTPTRSENNIFGDDHVTHTDIVIDGRGAQSDPSVGVVGVHIRQAK